MIENSDMYMYMLYCIIILFFSEALWMALHRKKSRMNRGRLRPGNKFLRCTRHPEEAHGFILGSSKDGSIVYSPVEAEHHLLVVGGSGLGKTTAVLIPSLLSLVSDPAGTSTSFTIDIAGDISSNVKGNNVLVYNPTALKEDLEPDSDPFVVYNVFAEIDTLESISEKRNALAALALLIMPDVGEQTGSNAQYYQSMGRKILTAALTAFYESGGMDFGEICEKICCASWQNLLNEIDALNNSYASSLLTSFEGALPEHTAGAKQNVDKALELFATDEILKLTLRRADASANNEIAFSPAMIETHNCMLYIPDRLLKYFKPLMQLLVGQVLAFFSGREKWDHKIFFFLDEAASLGQIDLLSALRKYRKYGIRVAVFTQSLVDLNLAFGGNDVTKAMVNNLRLKVLLEVLEPREQEYWASMTGQKTVIRRSRTKSGNRSSYTETEEKEYAIEPAQLSDMRDQLLCIYPGNYLKLKKKFFQ